MNTQSVVELLNEAIEAHQNLAEILLSLRIRLAPADLPALASVQKVNKIPAMNGKRGALMLTTREKARARRAIRGLVQYMGARGLSHTAVAKESGLSAAAISHWVHGRHMPSLNNVMIMEELTSSQ